LRNRHAQTDWELLKSTIWFYAIALLLYVLLQLCRTPGKLDADHGATEKALEATIAERDRTIANLTTKPPRTAAEQHHYDVARKTLDQFGPKVAIALRHLKTHGSPTFGTFAPPLPPGMNVNEALWAYNACVGEGLVTYREKIGSGQRAFEIAPTMNQVLDELLYEDNKS
jgi:hypothetical protein